jgi:hypothetical protein
VKKTCFAIALAIASVACGTNSNPLAPSIDAPSAAPTTYTCTTQLRAYWNPSDPSNVWYEIDTYTQTTPCPKIPID